MKRIFLLVFIFSLFICCIDSFSQVNLSGKILDKNTGEVLIGATVMYGEGLGTVTDFDGNYYLSLAEGKQTIKASYVGYKAIEIDVEITSKLQTLDFKLETILLNEIQVVSDIAIDRETPVAFTTIPIKKINEELASQDIPMLLNSTPGVYATQGGGGDGDARITIRGFNQRNVAVMIDGIPVNDMENGWVYWSNWFGLDAVTSNIQVQRGLGASKIAIPSVGGTMNILTKGTGNKNGGSIKQEVGSYGKLRTTLGYNSGRLKNGWGYTIAGSYKQSDGFVDQTWSEGYFYYLKIQKEIGKHILSLSAMGAPQQHGQRSYKRDIATYDTSYARELGDTSDFSQRDFINKGIQYNLHWGYLDRWILDSNGDTIHHKEILNTKQNYYHKPQFSLRDFWTINKRLYMSNILYASIGNGGGTSISGSAYDDLGQYNLQAVYNGNLGPFSIDPTYSDSEHKSGSYLKSSINNHYWYGALSTLNYQYTENIDLSGGLDFRYYKGEHYREIYDLLGGDYAIVNDDATQLSSVKRVGDKIGYHNDGLVKWGGVFTQLEYKNPVLSTFINLSASNSGYKRIDYFKKKDLVLEDTTLTQVLGTHPYFGELVSDTINYNGVEYTINSEEAKTSSSDWKWIVGYTIKAGANLNINSTNNIFFNSGIISKAPRFNNVYDYDNNLYSNIKNEIVKAVEGGYSYRSPFFSANINAYYTIWENKPTKGISYVNQDDILIKGNINGMNALHKGIEFDMIYKLNNQISIEGLVSLGDWIWTSSDTIRLLDENNSPILDQNNNPIDTAFDADGVHVGDAAQTQFGLSLRYEPNSKTYIKIRATHFDKHYADFDPLSLYQDNAGRESWMLPSYQLLDLHCGRKIKIHDNLKLDVRLSVLNLLDELYISDAQNNDPYNSKFQDFDAKSAGVFFGFGRRYNMSLKINF